MKQTELPETWDIKDIVEKKDGYGLCVFQHLSPDYKEWLPLKNIIQGDIQRPTSPSKPRPRTSKGSAARQDRQRRKEATLSGSTNQGEKRE